MRTRVLRQWWAGTPVASPSGLLSGLRGLESGDRQDEGRLLTAALRGPWRKGSRQAPQPGRAVLGGPAPACGVHSLDTPQVSSVSVKWGCGRGPGRCSGRMRSLSSPPPPPSELSGRAALAVGPSWPALCWARSLSGRSRGGLLLGFLLGEGGGRELPCNLGSPFCFPDSRFKATGLPQL